MCAIYKSQRCHFESLVQQTACKSDPPHRCPCIHAAQFDDVMLLTFEICHAKYVTFEWNVLLDLSREAATKTFGSLVTKLLLQILSQSTRAMTVWVIRGDEGVGDIPGIRGVQGVCRFFAT